MTFGGRPRCGCTRRARLCASLRADSATLWARRLPRPPNDHHADALLMEQHGRDNNKLSGGAWASIPIGIFIQYQIELEPRLDSYWVGYAFVYAYAHSDATSAVMGPISTHPPPIPPPNLRPGNLRPGVVWGAFGRFGGTKQPGHKTAQAQNSLGRKQPGHKIARAQNSPG